MSEIIASELDFDGSKVVDDLNRPLRLRTTPIGMKLFDKLEEMEQIPRVRRPKDIHTTDQIVGQAARSGWIVGITAEYLVGAQCSTVIGLHPRSESSLGTACTVFGLVPLKMPPRIKHLWMWCPSATMRPWR